MVFVSFPQRPFSLPALVAHRVLRRIERLGPEDILLGSIAAVFMGPWLAADRSPGAR